MRTKKDLVLKATEKYHTPKTAVSKRNISKRTVEFSADDISTLFKHKFFIKQSNRDSYKFWLMLLGINSGARLDELCQAQVHDVVIECGVPLLHIREINKNYLSRYGCQRRIVEIHPALLELGFMDYVKARIEAGEKFLLGSISDDADKNSMIAGRWFSHITGQVFPERRGNMSFHAFRSLFFRSTSETVGVLNRIQAQFSETTPAEEA
tara:strand:- start:3 stop:629 length:627 start_codon:yes stop_codon:yes gene_type:complete